MFAEYRCHEGRIEIKWADDKVWELSAHDQARPEEFNSYADPNHPALPALREKWGLQEPRK